MPLTYIDQEVIDLNHKTKQKKLFKKPYKKSYEECSNCINESEVNISSNRNAITSNYHASNYLRP